jgi:hypothetical protein
LKTLCIFYYYIIIHKTIANIEKQYAKPLTLAGIKFCLFFCFTLN